MSTNTNTPIASKCCWIKQSRPEPVKGNNMVTVRAAHFLLSLRHTHSCHTAEQLLSTRTIYRHDGKPLPFMGEKRLEGKGGRERTKKRESER